jgi:hypothetical protein
MESTGTYGDALDSVTLESLLIEYGTPERIAGNGSEAAKKQARMGRFMNTPL